jgi:NAD(P)-dependent dehydrogenase (short-subunit alcohol dehydrogenase family)
MSGFSVPGVNAHSEREAAGMAGAVIIGAGPGIGRSVALRFAREGLPVAVVARQPDTVAALAKDVAAAGADAVPLTADVTDEAALRAALDAAAGRLGTPDVVVYNAAVIRPDRPGNLTARSLLDTWAVNVAGALTAAAHTAPAMAARGGGSFLVTGGMPVPVAAYTSLSLGKAGVRTLVALLDEEYGPAGVHAASVTVAGPVAPGTAFDPDDIAEHYWRLHTQERGAWQREVVHGPDPRLT